jgi:hypothetical protein
LYMSYQLYPDVPAAMLTIMAVRALLKLPKPQAALILGVTLALMPWFHIRYIPIAVALGLIGITRISLTRQWRVLFIFATPFILSAFIFVGAYIRWYGSPLTNAQWRFIPQGSSSVPRFLKMLVAVAWDREVGVIPVAPIFLIALTGITSTILGKNMFMKIVLVVFIIYFCVIVYSVSAGIGTWGFAFPWRLIFPVVPLLILLISYAIDTIRPIVYLAIPLLIVSFVICLLASRSPAIFYPTETGVLPLKCLDKAQHLLTSMYYSPLRSFAATRGQKFTGQVVEVNKSRILCAINGVDQPGLLSWGIQGGAMPGEFQAIFSLKARSVVTGVIGSISLINKVTLQTVASRELTAADFPVSDQYESFILSFKTDRATVVGAQVQYSGGVDMCFEKITFQQTTATYPATSPYLTLFATIGAVIVGLTGGFFQRVKP